MRAQHSNRRGARRIVAAVAASALAATLLAACGGGESDKPVLTWYINPDPPPPPDFEGAFGQAGIAERCSTDEYAIETQILPQSATEQRIQMLRRLAAQDPEIDLMSLDPVFTAEFAEADYLAKIPPELSEGVLQGSIDGASWAGGLVVAPLWANTQILWYRKSMAEAAGLDMSQPVTWEQVIDAADSEGGKVGVQANKYEGYVVWINALIASAGGAIMTDTDQGDEAKVTIDSDAGREAAAVVQKLAGSSSAEADLSVSNEGTVIGPFADPGGFMVNWTFIYNTIKPDKKTFEDLGFARYPATVEGEVSKPPIGGINIGVSKYSDETELATAALDCITSEENQATYAVETGNMPASEAAYDDPELRKQFPEELLTLWLDSIDTAGPRPPSPYWGTIVNAVLNNWHPADEVGENTPKENATFIENVLSGDALL
ncbi:extracellular solute-binding protein [Aeromicrobium sp.]|uniref:extracellular solute-binding protein n=1 Tax=Aeromicrobium sp. TaxID=1871063 RepID=UPI003D6C2108